MSKIETALISVSDKTGLPEFARRLRGLGVEIISTGGTGRLLQENGIDVKRVSEYTGFPEILDGRVKTLHPKVHGGLLAQREKREHQEQLAEWGIATIDMVVVNLYPFEDAISGQDVEVMEAVDDIDIGGPTMIRSAAKNYTHVAVITSPRQYDEIAGEMERTGGNLREKTHYELAVEAFRHTAHYDAVIARYLSGIGQEPGTQEDRSMLEMQKRQELRYGENPHQSAAFYVQQDWREPGVGTSCQIAGPELSYNNILDLDAGLELVKEFDLPAAACIKQRDPAGAGTAESIHEAYRNAYLGDPENALGCIVALNRPFDEATAELVADFRASQDGKPIRLFIEAIAAPRIEERALKRFYDGPGWAPRTRLIETGPLSAVRIDETQQIMHRVVGGMLVEDRDLLGFDEAAIQIVTETGPKPERIQDLRFAWICCKHVRSNAVVLVSNRMLVGVGGGAMSRLDATRCALRKAGDRARGAVLASDAAFPAAEPVEMAAEAGVEAIIQPGGDEKDQDLIKAAERAGVAMVLTGVRHFRQ
jgi:phosphoribosylaminoimidazolecarboxamide formyltransferase/IMP cyclohydrolase